MVNANRLWHKQGVKPPRSGPRPRPPLTAAKLDELALHYVGRFATSKGKLIDYLRRKVRERGWEGERDADPVAIAERLAGYGYIDDAAFALSKARALGGRGYGARRVGQALHAARINEDDGAAARELADEEKVDAALRMARKRRVGPYATAPLDQVQREKAIGGMLRAGHGFALARAIVAMAPGRMPSREDLADLRGL